MGENRVFCICVDLGRRSKQISGGVRVARTARILRERIKEKSERSDKIIESYQSLNFGKVREIWKWAHRKIKIEMGGGNRRSPIWA